MTDIFGLKIIDTTLSPRPSLDSTDPDDFIFNSIWNTVKIWNSQLSSITLAAGASGTIEINHNLSFIPASIIYIETNPDIPKRFIWAGMDTINWIIPSSYCDSTKLKIEINNPYSTTKTFRVFSLIFADNGQ